MSKDQVCPRCDGEGYTSKLGAFTGDDLNEWYGDSDERYEFLENYKERGGIYDEHCPLCKGQRVATKVQVEDWKSYLEDVRIQNMESGIYY